MPFMMCFFCYGTEVGRLSLATPAASVRDSSGSAGGAWLGAGDAREQAGDVQVRSPRPRLIEWCACACAAGRRATAPMACAPCVVRARHRRGWGAPSAERRHLSHPMGGRGPRSERAPAFKSTPDAPARAPRRPAVCRVAYCGSPVQPRLLERASCVRVQLLNEL